MTKQTKLFVGVGLVAVAGYLLYNQYGKKKFAGYASLKLEEIPKCMKGYSEHIGDWYICCDPRFKSKNSTDVECTKGVPATSLT